jgi:hypothetical protein
VIHVRTHLQQTNAKEDTEGMNQEDDDGEEEEEEEGAVDAS